MDPTPAPAEPSRRRPDRVAAPCLAEQHQRPAASLSPAAQRCLALKRPDSWLMVCANPPSIWVEVISPLFGGMNVRCRTRHPFRVSIFLAEVFIRFSLSFPNILWKIVKVMRIIPYASLLEVVVSSHMLPCWCPPPQVKDQRLVAVMDHRQNLSSLSLGPTFKMK